MRILFIRHGDPDYVNDTLTEKGHREAALLAELAPKLRMGTCYVSPLGRAQDTAAYTLKKLGKTAETLDWLREFPGIVDLNQSEELREAYSEVKCDGEKYESRLVWDMLPSYWTAHEEYLDKKEWRYSEAARVGNSVALYDSVTAQFDELLKQYGYVREGFAYRVEKENTETITCFCHFGVTCVLLAHLLHVSPFLLWHGLALAPTSVTEVVTEERQKGIASFRALRLGDVSHLYMGEEPTSFAARFCEVYSKSEERH